ncbi:4'-phosphopantetheinyl transferase superfamily protein [Fulvivirga sp. 29W222]|uniref:4'-phosphopantetheinyl transferase superfamily protein n=1 Tax=Fulvivirga marina TaxID=2494733 RepID=A0A937G0G4_9BACT|nr:4'-phosphopantetheinyl transferase superfamily protein [Fulvivirga marina]MBL6447833.1 4'-phosphopantetheinyl transferase superfamily protein [Fulvivirga marina]
MIHLLYSSFNEKFAAEKYNSYLNLLPRAMVQRIGRYRRWQDAHAGLIGKLLLIEGLKKYGGNHLLLNDIKYSEYDRPYLDEVEFNISHSGNYVLCAISNDKLRIGVDVEEVKPIDFDDFDRQFTEAEWQVIKSEPDPLKGFFKMWTKKEAIVKADGKGLSIPLNEIIINGHTATVGDDLWYLENVDLDRHHIVHLACDRNVPEGIDLEQLSF